MVQRLLVSTSLIQKQEVILQMNFMEMESTMESSVFAESRISIESLQH